MKLAILGLSYISAAAATLTQNWNCTLTQNSHYSSLTGCVLQNGSGVLIYGLQGADANGESQGCTFYRFDGSGQGAPLAPVSSYQPVGVACNQGMFALIPSDSSIPHEPYHPRFLLSYLNMSSDLSEQSGPTEQDLTFPLTQSEVRPTITSVGQAALITRLPQENEADALHYYYYKNASNNPQEFTLAAPHILRSQNQQEYPPVFASTSCAPQNSCSSYWTGLEHGVAGVFGQTFHLPQKSEEIKTPAQPFLISSDEMSAQQNSFNPIATMVGDQQVVFYLRQDGSTESLIARVIDAEGEIGPAQYIAGQVFDFAISANDQRIALVLRRAGVTRAEFRYLYLNGLTLVKGRPQKFGFPKPDSDLAVELSQNLTYVHWVNNRGVLKTNSLGL